MQQGHLVLHKKICLLLLWLKPADYNDHSPFHLLTLPKIQMLLLNNSSNKGATVAKAISGIKPSCVIILAETRSYFSDLIRESKTKRIFTVQLYVQLLFAVL